MTTAWTVASLAGGTRSRWRTSRSERLMSVETMKRTREGRIVIFSEPLIEPQCERSRGFAVRLGEVELEDHWLDQPVVLFLPDVDGELQVIRRGKLRPERP